MIVDGFFDWAVRKPGPPDRWEHFGSAFTNMSVICHHSMEGRISIHYDVMRDPRRFPTAWHGTVATDGTLLQHYHYRARLQHGNSANTRGPGFEAEGFAGEPLTLEQEDTYIRIHKDIEEAEGRPYLRVPGSMNGLVEHREMANFTTACPSGRYDHLWQRIAEGDTVTKDELKTQLDELNRALMMREDLRHIASGPWPEVIGAHNVLRETGRVPERK